MKAHVLQHVSYEDLGSIATWLEERQAEISYTRFFEAYNLPTLDSIDLLIVLGGPMSVNDEGKLPWLAHEKQFIRDVIAREIPLLGICLGAQLIANAMGASVYRNPIKEIGWLPVHAVPTPSGTLHLPNELIAFHWHGETFDLPPGAVHCAESNSCKNQAFQLNRNAIGLQFHLETTVENALALLDNCRNELVPGPAIQRERDLRYVPLSPYRTINIAMDNVLSYLIAAS
jgi:GMP synthase-like glutamine amidotransferase